MLRLQALGVPRVARGGRGGASQLRGFSSSAGPSKMKNILATNWDAIVVGGGHNGLIAATYLAKQAKKRVLVLEKRDVIGGACVTEEIIPGFKFSRASYLQSLLRPQITDDLRLREHGMKLLPRDPSSFTPMLDGRHLSLGANMKFNQEQIAKFSTKDAQNFPAYEHMLNRYIQFFEHFIDKKPLDLHFQGGLHQKIETLMQLGSAGMKAVGLGREIVPFLEMMTAPATKILKRWFESEPLLSTLATDAIIGAMLAPSSPGSAYVLFHHVMGETNGVKGVWAHVEGGMGSITQAISRSAAEHGVEIATGMDVKEILTSNGCVTGVLLADGTSIRTNTVLSNATPDVTFKKLLAKDTLPSVFEKQVDGIDYSSGVFKINVAVNSPPNFKCIPNKDNQVQPHHYGTTHLVANLDELESGFLDALNGQPSRRPIIEMNTPSSLDRTISPDGKHVVLLFCQYAPYKLKNGSWADPKTKQAFVNSVFGVVEEYCPGFKESIVGYDALSPLDLENIFGLTGGNIFHGSMGLDQLFWLRPTKASGYRSPIDGLYLCGAGTHPGGGVMGAPGRNCALTVIGDLSMKPPATARAPCQHPHTAFTQPPSSSPAK